MIAIDQNSIITRIRRRILCVHDFFVTKMFKPNENYEVDRRILKCDYIRYSPAETSTMNTPKSQMYISIPREDSVISLLTSYIDLNFEIIKKADNSRYANGNDKKLINLGPIALFSSFKLTTSTGKHLEYISHAHLVSLMFKLITSSKNSDDLSVGFDRSRARQQDEMTDNKRVKGKYHVRTMLKDIFGFAEHQEKATFGLDYKLTLTRNKDEAVIDKSLGIANARIKIDHIHWYVPHYIPFMQQQAIMSEQILNNKPTELRYVERSVFMKEVNNQNLWNFELGSRENMNVPIGIIIGFQQQDRQDSQNLNKDTFCRLPIVSAQCVIGTKEYPDAGILLNYDDDDYAQGYHQIKQAFKALTKDDILQAYISEEDFRSSNVAANDVGYNLYVFDIRHQKNFTASQPIKVEFKFDGIVPHNVNGYALVLTNKLISMSSDGERQFDLI